MKRITAAAAALAATATLSLAPAATADPPKMNRTEWNQVSAGQIKPDVEAICACTGVKTQFHRTQNGNDYWYWDYLTGVGHAFIGYRWNNNTQRWVVGYVKYWCIAPDGDLGIPEGGCEQQNT